MYRREFAWYISCFLPPLIPWQSDPGHFGGFDNLLFRRLAFAFACFFASVLLWRIQRHFYLQAANLEPCPTSENTTGCSRFLSHGDRIEITTTHPTCGVPIREL
jgi:hypothetical protein